ncbi:hypothetical protein DV711_15275 [Motiliproteus coralliicola]|uniref:Uncharacterized protein n=1 Tax=Motiliproteus coralliicola TaxID=2283196 RepID=A0A369WAD3_9GAMM|nr:hypothetical protein [Motiliproteus coralliicola]RDE18968.1 hypothetical protein DV711_15275 [Motiliproteus coralliicola]
MSEDLELIDESEEESAELNSEKLIHPETVNLDKEIEAISESKELSKKLLNELEPDLLPSVLFSTTSQRLRGIINDTEADVLPIQTNNTTHTIRLNSLTYVDAIYIEGVGYSLYDSLSFRCYVDKEVVFSKEVKCHKSRSDFAINIERLVTHIEIKTPSKMFTSTSLKSICVTGTELKAFGEIEKTFREVTSTKLDILKKCNEATDKFEKYKDEYSEIFNTKEKLQSEIEKQEKLKESCSGDLLYLNEKLDKRKKAVNIAATELSDRQRDLESLDRDLTKEREKFNQLAKDISIKESELRTLKSNINLFPSELSDYAKEGGKSLNRYMLISVLPMLVIAFISIHLYFSAADLADYVKDNSGNVDLAEVIISRLPYVLLSFTILGACSSLIYRFISEAIRITEQKLNLSKVSIIAKDVSDASCSSLDFSDDEIYEKRVSLKMELLKEHLKTYIREDYHYKEKSKNKPIESVEPNDIDHNSDDIDDEVDNDERNE